jgi:Flp pilus assembly protein TadG
MKVMRNLMRGLPIRDKRGTALVEFAVTAPFVVLLYLGSYQLCDAISVNRKVTITTRALADLTSQYAKVSNADLDTILNASQQVLAPYSINSATMLVSQIKIDATGTATVDWSVGKNCQGLPKGTAFSVPTQIKTPNTYIIVAYVNYAYTPKVASGMFGSMSLHDQIIMSPRQSNSVAYT